MRRQLTALAIAAVVMASMVAGAPARAATSFVLLQMNLCNSGLAIAACYSFGKAVDNAVADIHRHRADLVTAQEVCRSDLYTGHGWGRLAQAVADLYGNVSVDFTPAGNRYTGEAYRCANGELYGVAVMHDRTGRAVHSGWYRSQDSTDEVRAWTCITVIEGRLTACTTHLSTDPDVAVRQCAELASILASAWVLPEVIVAGDFNLMSVAGKPDNVQDCVPAGYDRRSDSALQHVLFTRNIQWVEGWHESMPGTDHPLLYERFLV